MRFVKTCTLTMSVWIAVSEPITADFNFPTAVSAETPPSCFVPFDPLIYNWFDYFEITELLVSQIMFELMLSAAT